MSPVVTVIIPTYNRRYCLSRAVASVQAQSFTQWQLWIIDDGSTDDTAEWVQGPLMAQDSRIHYLRTENLGVSHARNEGWLKAQTSWVALLDSDDEWRPTKLEKQLHWAATHPHKIIHTEELWVRRGVRVNPMKKHKKSGGRLFSQCLPLCCISPSTVMLHKSLFAPSERPFREDFPVCEDYELWLRLCSQYEVGFLPEPLITKYGGHEDQLSRKYIAMDYWRLKAMSEQLDNKALCAKEHEQLCQEMKHKAKILLKGYQKHNNLTHYNRVLQWQNLATMN